MQKYKICPLCGKQFHVCYTCEKSSANSWKTITDSFEHFSIYTTLVLYKRGTVSKEEAQQRLSQYDLSDLTDINQRVVDEIMC